MSKTQSASPKPFPLPSLAIQHSWTALCPLPHCEFFPSMCGGAPVHIRNHTPCVFSLIHWRLVLLASSLWESHLCFLSLKLHEGHHIWHFVWVSGTEPSPSVQSCPLGTLLPQGLLDAILTCFPPSSSCASQTFPDSFLLKCTNRYFSGVKHCCFHLDA